MSDDPTKVMGKAIVDAAVAELARQGVSAEDEGEGTFNTISILLNYALACLHEQGADPHDLAAGVGDALAAFAADVGAVDCVRHTFEDQWAATLEHEFQPGSEAVH